MIKQNKKIISLKGLLLTIIPLILILFAFSAGPVSAENCPANTTVSGTTVTFVGELADMGGDTTTEVWFEYGKTTSYGQTTDKKTMTSTGFYCLTVSGLEPNTTYNYRAAAENKAGLAYGLNKTFKTAADGPSVDIKANGSNGPITIPYNTSATLSWSTSNVDSCYASSAWSGTKSTSGSQSTGPLTFSRTYTLTCTGPGGTASDSVTVNVQDEDVRDFAVKKTVRNLSRNTAYADLVYANPGDVLMFGIVIQAGNRSLSNVNVKDVMPEGLIYQGEVRVDNILTHGSVITGLNIGSIPANQKKTITFKAQVAGWESFPFGQTELNNSASVSTNQGTLYDNARVIVTKAAVAGIATKVPTGLTNNVFIDSFVLPLLLTLFIVWLLKARIINLEEWLDKKKKAYQAFKSRKSLQVKVGKIKTQEFFKRII